MEKTKKEEEPKNQKVIEEMLGVKNEESRSEKSQEVGESQKVKEENHLENKL